MSAAFHEAAKKLRGYLTHLDGHGTARDAEKNLDIMMQEFVLQWAPLHTRFFMWVKLGCPGGFKWWSKK